MSLHIPDFPFDSPLTEAVFELERLRGDLAMTDTDPGLLGQIHQVLQLLTSMTSARIEGNRTTVLDVVTEKEQSDGFRHSDAVQEIVNLEKASEFIDAHVRPGTPISQVFIRELHRIAVEGLDAEGDRTPGSYRTRPVAISGARHVPPGPDLISSLMGELADFINAGRPGSLDLVATAVSHHRFLWIHPFGNGNGRVARLLTYAVLVQQGFTQTTSFRALNPTAVFGADRDRYYEHLADADTYRDIGLVRWCEYVLLGLRDDLERVKSLGEASFVRARVLSPAIDRLLRSSQVTASEAAALRTVVDRGIIKASDLAEVFPGSSSTRSQQIRGLVDRHLLARLPEAPRSYRLQLSAGPLVPAAIGQLEELDFVPAIMRGAI
ncbi:Fic family protein [Cellulosimicrobium funkei]|nr:Fic family protein [Cellulosimicrobium funkei]